MSNSPRWWGEASATGDVGMGTICGPLMFGLQVRDQTGSSGASAFDFLSDGTPEPIYSDERTAFVWTESGPTQWSTSLKLYRRSETFIEHPSVVDVDNDRSTEVLVVSSARSRAPLKGVGTGGNDWTQARRISEVVVGQRQADSGEAFEQRVVLDLAAAVVMGNQPLMLDVAALMTEGAIWPVIGARFALDQVVEAHEELDKGRLQGAVVLCIAQDPQRAGLKNTRAAA